MISWKHDNIECKAAWGLSPPKCWLKNLFSLYMKNVTGTVKKLYNTCTKILWLRKKSPRHHETTIFLKDSLHLQLWRNIFSLAHPDKIPAYGVERVQDVIKKLWALSHQYWMKLEGGQKLSYCKLKRKQGTEINGEIFLVLKQRTLCWWWWWPEMHKKVTEKICHEKKKCSPKIYRSLKTAIQSKNLFRNIMLNVIPAVLPSYIFRNH